MDRPVTLGSEQVLCRTQERRGTGDGSSTLASAGYVYCGPGDLCDRVLRGPPLMSPSSSCASMSVPGQKSKPSDRNPYLRCCKSPSTPVVLKNRFAPLDEAEWPLLGQPAGGGVPPHQEQSSKRLNSATLRRPQSSIGADSVDSTQQQLCSLNFLDAETPELFTVEQQEFIDFEVVLDSGAADHVADSSSTPGYEIHESAGSKAGACFVAANGERIPNRGEVRLDLRAGNVPISSTFQVSRISRPPWSVGKVCDAGYEVTFKKDGATIKHTASGKSVGSFERKQGLYVGQMKLRNPSPVFSGQGK